MDIVQISTHLKDLEIKERKKNAASLNLTTAELNASEAAMNFNDPGHNGKGSSKTKKTAENRAARVAAVEAANYAAQIATNRTRYSARGQTYRGRGRGRSRGRGRGKPNNNRFGQHTRGPKIKSGQFKNKYDKNVWGTRQRATNARLAPSNFPYCYENDCMSVLVSGNLEEVPVCVICHTAKPARQGGHCAHDCPHEAGNLKKGFFKGMPDGLC